MTITSAPVDYSSIHGDVVYAVFSDHSSDSVTYPNFKYVADIYIDSVLVARIRKVQDPTTGLGIFNIGQILRNYVSATFNPDPSSLVAQILRNTEFYCNVVVSFGEEYNYTTYPTLISSASKRFYNHYNGRLVGISNALTAKLQKFATNNNLTGYALLSTNHYFVPWMPPDLTGVNLDDPFAPDGRRVDVNVTPKGGGESFATSFELNDWEDLHVLDISPVVLNFIHPGAITDTTTSYTVEIVNSQSYTVNLICESMYQTYVVHFLNQYGGFESKLFTKVSRTKYKIDKKDYGKLNYTVDNSGVVTYKNSNGVYNESRSVYSSQFEEKLTLNTDILTDEEYIWLRDLIVSPMVYIQDGDYFFPAVISDSDYEPKKSINDDLTNLTITLEYGINLNAQFR